MNNLFKKTKHSKVSFIIAGILTFFIIASAGYGQKGFHMDEKKMVENYKRSSKFFESGKSLFKKNKFKKAKKEFQECLKIFPLHDAALYYLASIHYNDSELPKALECITKAKENFKKNTAIHAYSHQSYLEQLQKQKGELGDEIQKYQQRLTSANLTQQQRQQIQSTALP